VGRRPAFSREHDFPRIHFRGCSYFFMFRPPRLLAPQIAPTAANIPAGRPRLLRPSRTCVVAFARIGYTIRLTTGNWRNEDFHLARFSALSAAPYLCESFLRCLSPCHGGPMECLYLFLPPCHRPSPTGVWVGFPLKPANTTFCGAFFEAAAISLCSGLRVCSSPRSFLPLRVPPQGSRDFLHPGRTCFVASARTGHASRPNTGNWRRRDFHPARFAALSAAPPCLRFTESLAVSAQDSGPSGSLVLSRKNFAFSASCRFNPAHKYRHYTHDRGV
jgi:hypothetical protein